MKDVQRILIVDDEDKFRSIIAQKLSRRGYEIFEACNASEVLPKLREMMLDVILLDLKLPDGDGLTLLPQLKELQPNVQVIMLTGQGTIESAIEAMKRGAYDFLTKPCSFSKMEITIQKALEKKKLIIENTGLREVVARQAQDLNIVAVSPDMMALLEMTQKIAKTDEPVLILGESGVGKELIARAIHLWSLRANSPYIPLNAGAIPDTLMENELFGHDKGAFTGAGSQKVGLIEMAHQGTLFFDEIGEMPISLQVKLLRFLETGEFRRVGDTKLRRVSVRIISATNRNLNHEVNQKNFRNDLFYRLNGLTIEIPPLRNRKEDIIPLVEFFLKKEMTNKNSQPYILSDESKEALFNYNYPGNVRELAHLVKRGQILSTDGIIKPEDIWPTRINESEMLPEALKSSGRMLEVNYRLPYDGSHNYPSLEEMERAFILNTLKIANGNRAQTAKLLGISVRNLYRKLETYEDQSLKD